MTCGIYKIVNNINDKMYIGQSVDIPMRFKKHVYCSNYEYKNSHLYSAIRKYGLDNFVFSVIVECDEHMLDEFEIGIIKLYDTTNPEKGYNKTFGGGGIRATKETKQKMSESKKGVNHPMFGKTLSDETKQKISESSKGKKSALKQYLYRGNVYNGIQELADFLGTTYTNLTTRIRRKQIDVTIIPKKRLL